MLLGCRVLAGWAHCWLPLSAMRILVFRRTRSRSTIERASDYPRGVRGGAATRLRTIRALAVRRDLDRADRSSSQRTGRARPTIRVADRDRAARADAAGRAAAWPRGLRRVPIRIGARRPRPITAARARTVCGRVARRGRWPGRAPRTARGPRRRYSSDRATARRRVTIAARGPMAARRARCAAGAPAGGRSGPTASLAAGCAACTAKSWLLSNPTPVSLPSGLRHFGGRWRPAPVPGRP